MLHTRLNDCSHDQSHASKGFSHWVLERGDILTGMKQVRICEYNSFRGEVDLRDDLSAHGFSLVLAGEARYTLRGKIHTLHKGDFLYVPPLEEYALATLGSKYRVLAIDAYHTSIDEHKVAPSVVRVSDRTKVDTPQGYSILQEKILSRSEGSTISDISVTDFVAIKSYESRTLESDLMLYVLGGQAMLKVPYYDEHFAVGVGDLIRIPARREFTLTVLEKPFQVFGLYSKPIPRVGEADNIYDEDELVEESV